MKLLLAAALYPPQEGGPATYAKLLVDELPARGVEVLPMLFKDVLGLPPGIRHLAYAWRLYGAGKDADVIFAQDPVSVGLPALVASFFLQKPLAVKVVGDHVWEQGVQRFGVKGSLDEFPVFSWAWHPYLWVLRFLQSLVVRNAERVIVPSEYLKRIVLPWGVPAEKLLVIYNGVHLEEHVEPATHLPLRPLIVTAARLVPWKGIGELIDVVVKESSWSLVVVGDGPERVALQKRALSAHERVRFTGTVPHAQALGWYQAADVFVLNSTYEGLSHTLLEVLHMGAPVVVTNVGGNPEVVTDGKEGLLIPAGDAAALHTALETILHNHTLAKTFAANGRLRAQDFSIQTTLNRLVVELNTLCTS